MTNQSIAKKLLKTPTQETHSLFDGAHFETKGTQFMIEADWPHDLSRITFTSKSLLISEKEFEQKILPRTFWQTV